MTSYATTFAAYIDGLVGSTPTEGSTTIAELNNAIREIKYAIINDAAYRTTTGNVTLNLSTENQGVIFINGAHTVTLPVISTVSGANAHQPSTKFYYICNKHASSNGTIKTQSSQTIDGVNYTTNGLIMPPGSSVLLATDGSNWFTIGGLMGHTLADVCELHRAQFRWKDADEIYIDAASYLHVGTKTQVLSWDSTLTFQIGSAGSNSDSSNAGTSVWHYLYIDDSSLTAGTRTLVAANFLNSTGAPVWSDAKKGWYGNGVGNETTSDRCVFAFYVGAGGGVNEWWHDGGEYVQYANDLIDRADAALATSFTEIDLTAPALENIKVQILGNCTNVDGTACVLSVRDSGSSATTGQRVTFTTSAITIGYGDIQVITSLSATPKPAIDIKHSSGTTNKCVIITRGWYFPRGM